MTENSNRLLIFATVLKNVIIILLLLASVLRLTVISPYTGEGLAIVDNNQTIFYSESLIEEFCDEVLELPCIPIPTEEEEQEDVNTVKRLITNVVGKGIWIADLTLFKCSLHQIGIYYTSLIFSPTTHRMRYVVTVLSTPA
jgi:hypothetical protein